MLESVPLGVVTWMGPIVAPRGTVALIAVSEKTVKVAGTPLKVTEVVPVKLLPSMPTVRPAFPPAGFG